MYFIFHPVIIIGFCDALLISSFVYIVIIRAGSISGISVFPGTAVPVFSDKTIPIQVLVNIGIQQLVGYVLPKLFCTT